MVGYGAGKFEVTVTDNYNGEKYSSGSFETYDEAVAHCKQIVDGWLLHTIKENADMTSAQLYKGYRGYGEDPWISPPAKKRFSAWDYAKAKCVELLGGEID